MFALHGSDYKVKLPVLGLNRLSGQGAAFGLPLAFIGGKSILRGILLRVRIGDLIPKDVSQNEVRMTPYPWWRAVTDSEDRD